MLSLAVECAIPSRAGAQLTSQTSYMGILVMPVSALAALTKQSIQKNKVAVEINAKQRTEKVEAGNPADRQIIVAAGAGFDADVANFA